MVRLKVRPMKALPYIIIFQFHYGTIKRLKLHSFHVNEPLFQFHYGTIKRAHKSASIWIPYIFQFHYGTIKSADTAFPFALHRNFNSTMVRLKD